MSQRTYFVIAGAFFIADAVFHAIRLGLWFEGGYLMQIPLWISPVAIIFSGFFGWHGLKMGVR